MALVTTLVCQTPSSTRKHPAHSGCIQPVLLPHLLYLAVPWSAHSSVYSELLRPVLPATCVGPPKAASSLFAAATPGCCPDSSSLAHTADPLGGLSAPTITAAILDAACLLPGVSAAPWLVSLCPAPAWSFLSHPSHGGPPGHHLTTATGVLQGPHSLLGDHVG